MRIFRLGQRVTHIGEGVRIFHTRGAAAANPWWDPTGAGLCIWAAYQPKGAANLAASYTDLSGTGNNCAPGVAPTWDAVNGWKFNGINQYLDTGFFPDTDATNTVLVQYTNLVLGGTWTYMFGQSINAFNEGLWYAMDDNAGNRYLVAHGDFAQINVDAPVAANIAIAGHVGYKDGAFLTAIPVDPLGWVIRSLYLGATQFGVGPSSYSQFYCQAFALYDCTLTAPQVLAVAGAMAAL